MNTKEHMKDCARLVWYIFLNELTEQQGKVFESWIKTNGGNMILLSSNVRCLRLLGISAVGRV